MKHSNINIMLVVVVVVIKYKTRLNKKLIMRMNNNILSDKSFKRKNALFNKSAI